MSGKYLRIPGVAVWMAVVVILGAGACAFLIVAGVFAFRGDYLTAVLSLVATLLFVGGARFEINMNNDYYLINDDGVKVVRNGKQKAMIRWEEFTDAVMKSQPYNGRTWFYAELRAKKEKDGVCIQDKRISIPMPLSMRKNQMLLDYIRRAKLKIDYAGEETEEINARLR